MKSSNKNQPASSHHLEGSEVSRLLGADCRTGLSAAEVKRRQAEFGFNVMKEHPGVPSWMRFLQQFNQPLVYLLLAAVLTTGLLREWVDCGVILGVVLINAVVGFLQEVKAEKAISALGRMVLTEATVRRDGRKQRIPSTELVPGDVVVLEGGDRVPADLRLFHVHSLQVDESALTGESLPVSKHAAALKHDVVLADRKNQAYAGTNVTSGAGEGLVWATGDRSEMGRIAWLIAETVEVSTPLTRKIASFSKLLLKVILALAALTFAVGLLRGESAVDMFMVAVALAVGAIPEGLPAAVTIVLAIGVSRMAKRRAIIRKMPAVETLGGTTVICSDKTGTLTENQMTVQRVFAGGRGYDIAGIGYQPTGDISLEGAKISIKEHPALQECLLAGVLCNEAQLVEEGENTTIVGDPTEAAMLVAGAKAGLVQEESKKTSPRVGMIPFESEHMFRATLHEGRRGRLIYKVGAVERLLERCSGMLAADGGTAPVDKDLVRREVEKMASQGMRVLALARRSGPEAHSELTHEHVKEGMVLLGLQGMIDPPRAEAVAAVARCRQAGILVKMITGDHALTAKAIAEKIGLGQGKELETMTGRELEKVSDEDLPEVAHRIPVFARVAPEQKLRLVRALQTRGHVVAMTGDGVNDAPALKQADIGIAMGITGTDVAKGAADMVLTDDNFATIGAAIEEGRGVFDNLRKFIVWTLPTNVGEGGLVLIAIFFGLTLPILPVQLLWINMSTSLFLGLMLVFEPNEPDLMKRAPRDPKRPLLTYPLFMRTGLVSLIMISGAFWLFYHELNQAGETIAEARTAVINVIVMVETAYLFSSRSLNHSLFSIGLLTNRLVLMGAALMIGAQMMMTYIPAMNRLFHTVPLSGGSWLRILSVALFSFIAVELEKWIRFGGGRGAGRAPE